MQALHSQQSARQASRVASSQQTRPTIILLPRAPAQTCAQPSARCVSMRAGTKLGDISLFGDSGMSLSGAPASSTEPKSKLQVDDVPLESEVGMDYTPLRDHLKVGDFRLADDETRALLIRLAGDLAIKRGWVYFSEIKSISNKDFQTIDNLWKAASNGKFGYSVQKEMFVQNQKRWGKFFKQIDWTHGENNNYRKWPMEFTYSMDAPRGHLPLTNALRGTQAFEALLGHPAWDKTTVKKSIDDKAKEAGANTLKW